MLPTFNPSKNEWGITFYLDAVQVKNAEYADISEDFGIMSDDTPKETQPDDPFSTPPSSKPTTDAGSSNLDFDDEIPF